MQLLGSYINGNYKVSIFDDGTKIRENDLDFFIPTMPESMDIKITSQCECGCPYCFENSTPEGQHGDIMNAKFIETLPPYTELAIGGGNPLSHPDLIPFLKMLKSKKLIANITVNQKHFIDSCLLLKDLCAQGLIHGLGVSLTHVTDVLIDNLYLFSNSVIHIINGIVDTNELQKLYDKDFKILILGYKEFRKGKNYYSVAVEKNKLKLYDTLPLILQHFKVVSFDNLAIKQLNVSRLLNDKQWHEFYMGDDGQFTMYIDMVNQEFASSSTSTVRWPMTDDMQSMFETVIKHN